MLDVINLVLPLFGLVFLGYVSGRAAGLPLAGLDWLNFFVVYVALPAMFFRLLSRTPLAEFANFSFIAASIFATFIVFALAFALAGYANGGKVGEATIQGFAASYGNIGYMGPPLAIGAFGPAAGVPVALIFCFENAMHFTLAPMLMAYRGGSDRTGSELAAQILRNILTHPFILATIAGVAAAAIRFEPPPAAARLLDILAAGAAPCALFAMGVTAALRPLRRVPTELVYLMPMKLLFHPLAMLFAMSVAARGAPAVWVETAILLAALPSATNVFVLAQQYGVWQERASSAVVLSTAAAVFTVTAYVYLARQGFIAAFLNG
jgi:predicted permease